MEWHTGSKEGSKDDGCLEGRVNHANWENYDNQYWSSYLGYYQESWVTIMVEYLTSGGWTLELVFDFNYWEGAYQEGSDLASGLTLARNT